jgi:hypothetical protein
MGPWDMRWTGFTYLCYLVFSFLLVSCIFLVGHSFVLCTLSSFAKIDNSDSNIIRGFPCFASFEWVICTLYI